MRICVHAVHLIRLVVMYVNRVSTSTFLLPYSHCFSSFLYTTADYESCLLRISGSRVMKIVPDMFLYVSVSLPVESQI